MRERLIIMIKRSWSKAKLIRKLKSLMKDTKENYEESWEDRDSLGARFETLQEVLDLVEKLND